MKSLFSISILALGLCLWSCGPNQQQEASNGKQAENIVIENKIEGSEQGEGNENAKQQTMLTDSTSSGNPNRMMGFNPERDLPLLYPEIQYDQNMLATIQSYGNSVVTGSGISGDQEILELLDIRETKLIPYFYSLVESLEEKEKDYIGRNHEQLSKELRLLGMEMNFAEGSFVEMGVAPFMETWIDQYGSEGLKLYTQFQVANSESHNGEYPYLNMEPRIRKVVIGEKLASLEDTTYFKKVEELYEQALFSLTDIHKVYNPNNRQEESFLVDGISTDMYPYVTEKKTRSNFIKNQSQSRYSKLVEKILDNPSEISNKPQQLYVIVTEWLNTRQMAQKRVIGHLNQGKDIPHFLEIKRGDGTNRFAVAYRFYENEEKANEAFEKVTQEFPDASLIYCSIKNGTIYQVGPSSDL